ncbi:MAG: nitrophenyl compound nitroreductase subunit ArsF family protein [Candidatus Delongbacteria bacterium]
MTRKTWILLALLGFVLASLGKVAVTHWLPRTEAAAENPTATEQLADTQPEQPMATAAAVPEAPGEAVSPATAIPATAPAGKPNPAVAPPSAPAQSPESPPSVAPATAANPARVIVYYFHGAVRCKTCRTIEDTAREALDEHFARETASGQVEWRLVNVDDPKHEHFVEDYQLTTRSIVLSRLENGKETAWRRLDWVWELVKDHDAFLLQFQKDLRGLLEGKA